MIFLAGEILFCLILTLATGIITGWTLKGIQSKHRLKTLENLYRINMASLESKKNDQ